MPQRDFKDKNAHGMAAHSSPIFRTKFDTASRNSVLSSALLPDGLIGRAPDSGSGLSRFES